MAERPRFFDDISGVAQGAFATLAGLRDETGAMMRARTDSMIERLELVRREELEAIKDLAANARSGQEAAEARLSELEARYARLESRLVALEGEHGAEAEQQPPAKEASADATPPVADPPIGEGSQSPGPATDNG